MIRKLLAISLIISVCICTNSIAYAAEVFDKTSDISNELITSSDNPEEDVIDESELNSESESEPEPEPELDPDLTPVPLEKPEITKHIVTKGYYMKLEWTPVEHASAYVVEMKDPVSGVWKKVKTYDAGITRRSTTAKKDEGSYTFRVSAIAEDSTLFTDSVSDEKTVYYLGTTDVKTATVYGRVRIDWSPVENATGYLLYTRESENSEWTYIKTIYGVNSTSYYYDGAPEGEYYYCVRAINGSKVGVDRCSAAYGNSASVFKIEAPSNLSTVMLSSGDRAISWDVCASVDGYELQYDTNRLFMEKKRVLLSSQKSKYTVREIPAGKSFFTRIRSYKTVNGVKRYSRWVHCDKSGSPGYTTYERIEYGAGAYDLRTRSGQSMYYYDTVQGGCTDGVYAYYTMNRRTVDNCKIVKMRLSDYKIVMVSEILPIDHGNGITYNPDTNQLIVNNCTKNPKRLTVINPDTLKVIRTVDISIPSTMTGSSSSESTGITGFSSITYNRKKEKYVVLTKGKSGFLFLDKNFNVMEYMPLDYKNTGKLWQCIDSTDEYLMIAHSPGSAAQNVIAVYDWQGRFVTNIILLNQYELENIYHVGTQFYATYYVTDYSSGELNRKNYIFKFNLKEERSWVKYNVAKPTKPYMPKSPVPIKPKKSAVTASVKLNWYKSGYGKGYKIYRAASKNGKFTLIKTLDNLSNVSYTDKNLKRNKTYYYKIRSYKVSRGRTYYSKYTAIKSVKTL